MKYNKFSVKLLSFILVLTMTFSLSLPLTASAIVAGEDTAEEFRHLTFEEMQELSQAELVAYCRAFYAHEFPEEDNTVNPEGVDPNQMGLQWHSEANTPGYDYKNYTTQATHCYFTAYAILAVALYTKQMPFTDDELFELLKQSEMPDRIYNSHLWVNHFYDPATGENCIGSKNDTAIDTFLKRFNNAVNQYQKGNRQKAIEELGYSLHFIQDVCEPHHSNNEEESLKSRHNEFEQWVADNLENIGETISLTQSDFQNIRYSSQGTIFNNAAWSGKGYLKQANSTNTAIMKQAADPTVTNSIEYTALVIYYFVCITGIK